MDEDPQDATLGSYHLWALRIPPAGRPPGRPSGWGAPGSPVENRQELSAHDLLLLKILSGFSFLVSKNLCLGHWARRYLLCKDLIALFAKSHPYVFFRCTPPKHGNAGEKRYMDNGTWITRSHQKPSRVRDDAVGIWLGGNSSVLTWLCKEVNLKDSAFQINYWRLIMECWTCLFSIIRRETCLFHHFKTISFLLFCSFI